MFGTIAFLLLSVCYFLFLLYVLLRPHKFRRRKLFVVIPAATLMLLVIFMLAGSAKIKSDIARIIHNTPPKKFAEIYQLLFKKAIDSSISIIHLQDQVIPKIDCCIWIQLKVGPNELNRMLLVRKYKHSFYRQPDSTNFLQPFSDKPTWWRPQTIGDTITKASFHFSNGNEQTLFLQRTAALCLRGITHHELSNNNYEFFLANP
ncbi:hypothetical protein BH10BAC3_BH10BAC3_14370 [soil metagenome]